jgi:7-carboxy-7-deazaguanine synthase
MAGAGMNTYLPVNDIYASIQGEGVQAGTPMVILRLQGCKVGCPWCDTQETWGMEEQVDSLEQALGKSPAYALLSTATIADYIEAHYPHHRWVLVTGGEPAAYGLRPLVAALHSLGYQVALETSGTALGLVGAAFDWVTVSPKIGMPGGLLVQATALARADEIKHVVGRQADIDRLDDLLATVQAHLKEDVTICLQPVSQSPKATELCLETIQRRGWRLSLQLHKYLDLP